VEQFRRIAELDASCVRPQGEGQGRPESHSTYSEEPMTQPTRMPFDLEKELEHGVRVHINPEIGM
jgi:hypothetical protein